MWDEVDGCRHDWMDGPKNIDDGFHKGSRVGAAAAIKDTRKRTMAGQFCSLCGAWRGTLGLEPTPELYVQHLVQIFREVKRVLKPSGQMFLNMGDTRLLTREWAGLPHRLTFALQGDSWRFEDEIVWFKPNPMPGSQTNRTTRAHEMVFMLNKSTSAYFDQEAVREPAEYGRRDTKGAWRGGAYVNQRGPQDNSVGSGLANSVTGRHPETGRNIRSVWHIATQPYPEAHFATFPEKLVEPCIKAGSSEHGVCADCGKPWERVVEIHDPKGRLGKGYHNHEGDLVRGQRGVFPAEGVPTKHTIGWQPTCSCQLGLREPAVVLDLFAGSGTVGVVAQKLGRRAILVEMSEGSCKLAKRRLKTTPLPLRA